MTRDKKCNQKNAPRFDVQGQLYRMTGVDLTRIDGVDAYTALKVISEIGTDMTKWPSAKHFASWLGLSPNNRITGRRVISSKTKPSANRRVTTLVSGEQRYGRGRPVQRRLTGQSASAVSTLVRRVVYIIGVATLWGDPVG